MLNSSPITNQWRMFFLFVWYKYIIGELAVESCHPIGSLSYPDDGGNNLHAVNPFIIEQLAHIFVLWK